MRPLTLLTVPGLGSSGPAHWQTRWEQQHGCRRVEQRDWQRPVCAEWVATLEAAVAAAPGPVVLVAHSLACATVAHWAAATKCQVVGVLLVGPADVDRREMLPEVRGFAPMPLARLPFPSIVVASETDEYVTLARAGAFAAAWGSRLVNVGALGHLNSESGLGLWPAGWALVRELSSNVGAGEPATGG
ncbi:RBBP9/YdeN family alpha/beta hydrolase [Hymenobacter rubripertinctus]|uniref:Alpha/beta hydrolase n=1 Tax=Hymenobacter rubripertinctus TaxID=2029981 RepID=A0A418QLW6_9BACT|nr:alpha/beta hydrolase [Hymenobacter rubripertinctus]RIY06128.1 alpha/beta hydrolase [Hymenobacter rubripertinctus]